jgi:predicted adenylyl cyclase CyaB
MRNLEFKARLDDASPVLGVVRRLGGDLWGDLRQTDTYFAVSNGRLKLRETPGFSAELIYYDRDESAPDRPSDYDVAHTTDADALKQMLAAALGVLAVVRKRRTLLLLDTTRVHLDNVEGLGSFIEIEVPVRTPEAEPQAREQLEALIEALGLDRDAGLRLSYLDLMLQKETAL